MVMIAGLIACGAQSVKTSILADQDSVRAPKNGATQPVAFDLEMLKSRGVDPRVAEFFSQAPRFSSGSRRVGLQVNGSQRGNVEAQFDGQGQLCGLIASRAALSERRRWPSGVSVDGDVAGSSDAELGHHPDETTILDFRCLSETHELADVTQVDQLLHGEETYVCGDAGYIEVDNRSEHQERTMIWSIAARPSSYKKHGKKSLIGRMRRKIEYAKAQVRAKVEHLFRVIKRQFGYTKVRFRGLAKHIAQQTTLYALLNLWMVRKRLLGAGELRL